MIKTVKPWKNLVLSGNGNRGKIINDETLQNSYQHALDQNIGKIKWIVFSC